MKSYLAHLQGIGDNALSFSRKLGYIKYNFGKYIDAVGKQAKALEIGPGIGAVESYLNAKHITNIDVIDNDMPVLKYIQNNFKINKIFKTNNITKIESKLQTYDLIFMLQVFEHIPREQYKVFIQTLVKHLTRNGKIIIMVPNGGNPLGLLERYHDLQHENAYTVDSLTELPNYCGVDNVTTKVEGYSIPPYTFVNIVRLLLQKILHTCFVILLMINGGVYQTIMTPNITLIITKDRG